MKEINVYSQNDLDEIEKDFNGCIKIYGGDCCSPIIVRGAWDNGPVVACDTSSVVALGTSTVKAYDSSTVAACDNSTVIALGTSTVEAYDNSTVAARGNSTVEAWENSTVKAYGSSTVVAYGTSTVKACDNSTVVAYDTSNVVARGNSTVAAYDSSNVVACDNSTVKARDNSNVNYTTNNFARVILPFCGIDSYINYFGVKEKQDKIILYKAVRKDDHGVLTSYWDPEFEYEIGKTAHQADIDTDTGEECGAGLHVSTADFVLRNYANKEGSVIIECEVPKDKTVVYRFSDGKIRTSELRVLREVPLEELGAYGKIVAKKRKKGGAE